MLYWIVSPIDIVFFLFQYSPTFGVPKAFLFVRVSARIRLESLQAFSRAWCAKLKRLEKSRKVSLSLSTNPLIYATANSNRIVELKATHPKDFSLIRSTYGPPRVDVSPRDLGLQLDHYPSGGSPRLATIRSRICPHSLAVYFCVVLACFRVISRDSPQS